MEDKPSASLPRRLRTSTSGALGLAFGRWLSVERQTSLLVTAGTSICGGSAIAAVGPAIGARPEAISVALVTVFVLNAVALYLFPPIGQALELSQHQFTVWAAHAIHDTSSVVGAASSYGAAALQEATVLKLARALWIVPLTLAAAWFTRRDRPAAGPSHRRAIPWIIGLFVLAAVVRALVPDGALGILDGIAAGAREVLAVTLFLIGLDHTTAINATILVTTIPIFTPTTLSTIGVAEAEARVVGAVHPAHPARAERGEDLVGTEGAACGQHGISPSAGPETREANRG